MTRHTAYAVVFTAAALALAAATALLLHPAALVLVAAAAPIAYADAGAAIGLWPAAADGGPETAQITPGGGGER